VLLLEQIYLDLLFKIYPLLTLNNYSLKATAGSTLGFKHSTDFGLKRSGNLNPM
jgi:hypothetical protein